MSYFINSLYERKILYNLRQVSIKYLKNYFSFTFQLNDMKLLYKNVVRDGLQKQFSEGEFDMMQGSGDGGWKSFKKGVHKK